MTNPRHRQSNTRTVTVVLTEMETEALLVMESERVSARVEWVETYGRTAAEAIRDAIARCR